VEDAAVVVDEDGFDFFFVEIETGECHNSVAPERLPRRFPARRKVDGEESGPGIR
jgi:hypothetical protein